MSCWTLKIEVCTNALCSQTIRKIGRPNKMTFAGSGTEILSETTNVTFTGIFHRNLSNKPLNESIYFRFEMCF